MASESTSSYIGKALADNQIVTFRLLSRELSIHVNEAKNHLSAYHAHALSSGQAVYATYLLSGTVELAPETSESSMQNDEQIGSSQEVARRERRFVMVGENELEDAKTRFVDEPSIHVYSLTPAAIKELSVITGSAITVRQLDGSKDAKHARKVGMITAPDVKWTPNTAALPHPTKPKPLMPRSENVDITSKVGGSGPSSTKPDVASRAKPPIKTEPGPKKSGLLDWSKAKAKATPANSNQAPVQIPAVTTNASVKTEAEALPDKEPAKESSKTTAKLGSKQTTARPASRQVKQVPPTSLAVPVHAGGSKRATPASDSEDDRSGVRNVKRKSDASMAESSTAGGRPRVKRGRVLSDDEDDTSAAEDPPKRRKSEGISDQSLDDDTSDSAELSRVKKGKKAAAVIRAAKAKIDEDLQNLMLGSDDEQLGSGASSPEETMEDGNDSAPEHVPFTKKIKGMPKKPKVVKEKPNGVDITEKSLAKSNRKAKAPLGSNGKPKKKITKTRTIKMENGFTKREDYSDWETDDAKSEPESKPVLAKEATAKTEGSKQPTMKEKPLPKPKAIVKKKSTGGGTLNSFFTKK